MKLPAIPLGAAPGDPRRVASIEAYCQLMIDDEAARVARGDPAITGRNNHVWMVAVGIAESNLDNLVIGRNDVNGTPEDRIILANGTPINLHYSLGLGWIQHDSGWLLADEIINGVDWSVEEIRGHPGYSIDLLLRRPGFVIHQGDGGTFLDLSAWNAYSRARMFIREVDAIYGSLV